MRALVGMKAKGRKEEAVNHMHYLRSDDTWWLLDVECVVGVSMHYLALKLGTIWHFGNFRDFGKEMFVSSHCIYYN